MHVAPGFLDPLTTLIGVLEIDTWDHCNATIAIKPHVFTEELWLALETLGIVGSTEIDLVVQYRLGGEGDAAVPAGEDLEGSVVGKSHSRFDIFIVWKQRIRFVPRALGVDVKEGVARQCSCLWPALVLSYIIHRLLDNVSVLTTDPDIIEDIWVVSSSWVVPVHCTSHISLQHDPLM